MPSGIWPRHRVYDPASSARGCPPRQAAEQISIVKVVEAFSDLFIEIIDMAEQQSHLMHQGNHHQLIRFDKAGIIGQLNS